MSNFKPNKSAVPPVLPSVLIIHNITARLLLIKNTLSGFARIYAVKTREAALKALEHADVSLILLDLESPNLSAVEFLDFLQSSDRFGEIPVVAVTTNPQEAIDNTLKNYDNVAGVLGKPTPIEEIREMAAEILKADIIDDKPDAPNIQNKQNGGAQND